MTTGSCLCGLVRYEVSPPFKWMAHCHCSICRKHHGTLYSTALAADRAQFQWLSGEQQIARYRSSPTYERSFCSQCGSVVPDSSGDLVTIPAGTLQSDPGVKPRAHIFVASKSPMWTIDDDLVQFDEYPPGYGRPVSYTAPVVENGALTGSCLCGDVAFAVDEIPTKVVNCHCTRCQRSRGTAHATNAFVRQEHLRWLRGAHRARTYKVPEAQAFCTSFCERCGSLLPALFERINRYNVPVGCFDRPLDTKPGVHIYVQSHAPWHDITDQLPKFDEMPPRERVRELMF